jgi:hypothetical protein
VQVAAVDCQHCESLVDVVVKLSPDPSAFSLLRLYQPAVHSQKCLFRPAFLPLCEKTGDQQALSFPVSPFVKLGHSTSCQQIGKCGDVRKMCKVTVPVNG